MRAAEFQSTPPVKAATKATPRVIQWRVFQSTPPVKAATRGRDEQRAVAAISIHAAREGGDADGENSITVDANFNPRRP